MRFSGRYPLTADACQVCEKMIGEGLPEPVEKVATSPKDFPIHRWYYFVHSYSPTFVRYEIKKNRISGEDSILDPFVGAGTTLVEAKARGINSCGVDVIEFLSFASRVKTEWNIDHVEFYSTSQRVLEAAAERYQAGDVPEFRSELLPESYISRESLRKILSLKEEIRRVNNSKIKDLLTLVLASIAKPSSNIGLGPNVGLKRKKSDANVFKLFLEKARVVRDDLKGVKNCEVEAKVLTGDSRELSSMLNEEFACVITSPPYPQDHDYTRQLRLELTLLDFMRTKEELRAVKKRAIRASTRNVYAEDHERELVKKFGEVVELMEKIERRVRETGGKSGFEKLYSKLVGEYFGGMYVCLGEIYEVLENGGVASLLVADSHAFKMTHIQTASILAKMGLDVGFRSHELEVWRYIRSTAHDYPIPEYILRLHK